MKTFQVGVFYIFIYFISCYFDWIYYALRFEYYGIEERNNFRDNSTKFDFWVENLIIEKKDSGAKIYLGC